MFPSHIYLLSMGNLKSPELERYLAGLIEQIDLLIMASDLLLDPASGLVIRPLAIIWSHAWETVTFLP